MFYIASCYDGQLKLIGGDYEYQGRLQICSHQRWETLNYYEWTFLTAYVACNDLGFQCMSIAICMHS